LNENQRASLDLQDLPRGRIEDERFLRGIACYTDDLKFENTVYLGIVRSTYPHAEIKKIDFSDVTKSPDFLAFLSGEDILRLGLGTISGLPFEGGKQTRRHLLAVEKVRYVGEPVAAVLGKTRYSVEDLIELVRIEYDPLPPIVTIEESKGKKSLVYEEWSDNLLFEFALKKGEPDSVLSSPSSSFAASSNRVLERKAGIRRQAGVPIEPRSVIASYDEASGTYTVYASSQGAHRIRNYLSSELGTSPDRIHVIVRDVGGAFGTKGAQSYPEPAIACVFAKKTGRVVKWVSTRTEDLLETAQGRDEYCDLRVAFDSEGRVLAFSGEIEADLGVGGSLQRMPALTAMLLPGPYKIPSFTVKAKAYVTNKTPSGPVRGAGRPEATFFIETMIDRIAKNLGIDPIEIRRRNVIAPSEFPYDAGTGFVYDSANFPLLLDRLVEASDLENLKQWKRSINSSKSNSKVAGIGVCIMLEDTGAQLVESARIVAHSGGAGRRSPKEEEKKELVTIFTGSSPHGQGHETTLAKLASQELGIPIEKIRVVWGDTEYLKNSVGTFGSRSAVTGGSAVVDASRKLREQVITEASKSLNIDRNELSLTDGNIVRVDKQGRLHVIASFEEMLRTIGRDIEAYSDFKLNSLTFSSGAHLCALLLDRETGKVEFKKYVAVDDCGRVINRQIVDGQIHGGVAHGLGGAILEEISYDSSGQPLATAFLDYTIPTSVDVPDIEVEHVETPSQVTLNGARGVGESGTIAAYPAIFNAINDAIWEIDPSAEVCIAPATPEMIFRAIS
jgi:carbon-monoxide dehydrogenase large subunit